jgi:hypothetical protein
MGLIIKTECHATSSVPAVVNLGRTTKFLAQACIVISSSPLVDTKTGYSFSLLDSHCNNMCFNKCVIYQGIF